MTKFNFRYFSSRDASSAPCLPPRTTGAIRPQPDLDLSLWHLLRSWLLGQRGWDTRCVAADPLQLNLSCTPFSRVSLSTVPIGVGPGSSAAASNLVCPPLTTTGVGPALLHTIFASPLPHPHHLSSEPFLHRHLHLHLHAWRSPLHICTATFPPPNPSHLNPLLRQHVIPWRQHLFIRPNPPIHSSHRSSRRT